MEGYCLFHRKEIYTLSCRTENVLSNQGPEAEDVQGAGKHILQRRNIIKGEELIYETCNAVGL